MPKGEGTLRRCRQFMAILSTPLFLCSCASFNFIHDPQIVAPTRDQVPEILMSIRCELVTFYEANRQRVKLFRWYTKMGSQADRDFALTNFSYFEVSDDLHGGVFLDLKVVDAFGAGLPGASSSFDNKINVPNTTNSQVLHLGPTLNDQSTYQLVRTFLIEQSNTLSGRTVSSSQYDANEFPSADRSQCYKAIPQTESER